MRLLEKLTLMACRTFSIERLSLSDTHHSNSIASELLVQLQITLLGSLLCLGTTTSSTKEKNKSTTVLKVSKSPLYDSFFDKERGEKGHLKSL